ncbi:uncharacterized protein LOC111593961 [Drosophila hydei]|uniref:Uncharacterized protein LOC111593961 n=1 Tax=Drosophila hydei TaxID=7224 RepID=A0A6J2SYI7_DROHY|nr:uncharacterized protein LOC111593961 [Drosophila hydei]
MDNRPILLGLLLEFLVLSLNDAVQFKFTNFVCETINKSWVNITQCKLQAVSRNETYLNFNVTLLQPVNKDVLVEGQIFKRENGYKPWLYKASLDGCRFVRKPYNPIAIIVYKIFKTYSNINHTCPYEGYVLVQKLNLKFEYLPHAIPTGDYLLKLDWLIEKKLQLRTNVFFKFVEDL